MSWWNKETLKWEEDTFPSIFHWEETAVISDTAWIEIEKIFFNDNKLLRSYGGGLFRHMWE